MTGNNHPNRSKRVGRISKVKHPVDGWALCIDGKLTSLSVVRGPAPKYREPQEYEVYADGEFAFLANSLTGAMRSVDLILSSLPRLSSLPDGG